MKIRKKCPLPFQGNKSQQCDHFIKYIKESECETFVDLFGGSCFLSYVVRVLKPNATVVCNDYDNYMLRIENVDTTNEILRDIRDIVKDRSMKRKQKFSDEDHDLIIDLLESYEQDGKFVDCITLSAILMFSGQYVKSLAEMKKNKMFNNITKNDYDVKWFVDAMEGVKFVRKDWHELFEEFRDNPGVCFIADPPYLSTDTKGYKQEYWRMKDSFDTIEILRTPHFVYYTSEKSQLVEFVEYLNEHYIKDDPIKFDRHEIRRHGSNKTVASWLDFMLAL